MFLFLIFCVLSWEIFTILQFNELMNIIVRWYDYFETVDQWTLVHYTYDNFVQCTLICIPIYHRINKNIRNKLNYAKKILWYAASKNCFIGTLL